MTYDDALWHHEPAALAGLKPESAGTHIGMFLAWAQLAGLGSDLRFLWDPQIERLRARTMSPGEWFIQICGEKFVDVFLNEEGNSFASSYYDGSEQYPLDYAATLAAGVETLYEVPDGWATFDQLAPVLDGRLAQWRLGDLGVANDNN